MAYCLNPVCPQPQNRTGAKFCSSCGSPLTLNEKYRPESLLGRGGFGRTLLASVISNEASDPNGDRCVIKQIYSVPSETHSAFKAEAKRLEQLGKHPQIPRLLASIENSLGQFLVQEFASGETLEALVERNGTWEESEVRSLLISLVSVLQYVHSFKVIHRDIKPANIIWDKENSPDLPMLVDFGAAKWIGKEAAKTVVGSAGYAAPEQSMGQATFASDIYSLGLTSLHLLTGLHPFELYSIAEDRWVWQDYLPAPVSSGFAQVLDKMVARSLKKRYATMDDVAAGLKATKQSQFGTAKQLLERARESVLPLQNALKEGVLKGESLTEAFQKIAPSQPIRPAAVIVDPQHWSLHRRITASKGLTQSISVSAIAPIFATASSDGAVRIWDLASGECLHTFARKRFSEEGHGAAVTAVQFHPDGRALYSASDDGTLKEWDAQNCELMNTLPSTGWTPTALAISADGTTLVSANSDGRIVLWDIATLKIVGQLTQHQSRVNALAISEDGNLLVSAGEDGTLRLWQDSAGRAAANRMPQLAKVIRVESTGSPLQGFGGFTDERKGVVATLLQTAKANALQESKLQESKGFKKLNKSAQPYSYLVAATRDTVWRYELTPQCEVKNETAICRLQSAIRAISLSETGTLAVATEDRVLRLWQLSTAECVAELKHDWGMSVIAFSPDGKTLIAASADETLFIWRKEILTNF